MEQGLTRLTAAAFDATIGTGLSYVVEFYADWCAPCRLVEPALLELAGEYGGRARFFRVDADAETALSERYDISTLPCVIVFRDGKETGRATGARTKAALANLIERVL